MLTTKMAYFGLNGLLTVHIHHLYSVLDRAYSYSFAQIGRWCRARFLL
jgi:hypothetical protein